MLKTTVRSIFLCFVVVSLLIGVSFAGFESSKHNGKCDLNRVEGVVTTDDGTQLPYVMEGKGIPCIFVGSHIYYPQLISRQLKNHFRFVFVDERGFIPSISEDDAALITLDTLIDDMEAVRVALGFEKVAVIEKSGHTPFYEVPCSFDRSLIKFIKTHIKQEDI